MPIDIQEIIDATCRKLADTVRDFGILLTRDPESVAQLEQVLLDLKDMGDEEALRGACFMVGVHLGEVLRTRLGGSWANSSDGILTLRLGTGESIFPVEKVKKFVANPDDESIAFFVAALVAVRASPRKA